VFVKNQLSRWVGVVALAGNAIAQPADVSAYPFWSLSIFAIDILAIYGLLAYGKKISAPQSRVFVCSARPRLSAGRAQVSSRRRRRDLGATCRNAAAREAPRRRRGVIPVRSPTDMVSDQLQASIRDGRGAGTWRDGLGVSSARSAPVRRWLISVRIQPPVWERFRFCPGPGGLDVAR
jgi:hypothetical protein